MTAKFKKAKARKKAERRKARPQRAEGIELRASVEDDLFSLAEEAGQAEARWNRPTQAEDLVAGGYRGDRCGN
jgi:hypothetical protein